MPTVLMICYLCSEISTDTKLEDFDLEANFKSGFEF